MTMMLKSCRLAFCALFFFQSLADVAREEAERRKRIDQQGIEAKVIESGSIPDKNSAGSAVPVSPKENTVSKKSTSPQRGPSVRSFRTAIQKLDHAIQEGEGRLQLLRERMESERRVSSKLGKKSRTNSPERAQEKLRAQMENLEIKLSQLRQERSEIYQSGRKAGFLPGELDGKGIIP
jgi:predicted RNase H-like nuclease (RuvC/YqgF family)